VGIVLIVAQLKLFSIDKTLKAILSQVQSDRRAYEHNNMKMLLFELRSDQQSVADSRLHS
jgi:hypothetical protein